MKVVVSHQVKEYLEAEKRYLKRHSSTAHKRLAARLREAFAMLGRFPLAGPERQLPVSGLRRLVVDDYVLDYEIGNNELHVLAMRHGRQRDPYMAIEDDFDFEDDFGKPVPETD